MTLPESLLDDTATYSVDQVHCSDIIYAPLYASS